MQLQRNECCVSLYLEISVYSRLSLIATAWGQKKVAISESGYDKWEVDAKNVLGDLNLLR